MQQRANKGGLIALLLFCIFSISIISIKSVKAASLYSQFTNKSNYWYSLNSNFYCEFNYTTMNSTPGYNVISYLGLQDTSSAQNTNTFRVIPLKYYMLYQPNSLVGPVLRIYNEVLSVSISYQYTANQINIIYFLIFGYNPLSYGNLINILSNSYTNTNGEAWDDTQMGLFRDMLIISSGGYIEFQPWRNSNSVRTLKEPTFITTPQYIQTALGTSGSSHRWTYYVEATLLSELPEATISNDNLILQYNTYIEDNNLTSPAIDLLSSSAYVDGKNEVINNPNDYGLYSSSDYNSAFDDGYDIGLEEGKDIGVNMQLSTGTWFMAIFEAIGDVMAIEIFPGLSIGLIVMIPLTISLSWFIIRTLRGGGN